MSVSERTSARSRRGTGGRQIQGATGLAIVLLLALFATSCGDDGDTPTTDPGTQTTVDGGDGDGDGTDDGGGEDDFCTAERVGGELTMAVFSETSSMDPTVSTGTGTTGGTELSALYDTLMRYNAETAEYEPWLAEALEPNDDFSEWTLTLRPNVTFGNGDPLTAEVVQQSIARHQDPNGRSVVKAEVLQITSMEVVDDLTLRFVLAAPWGTFPYVLADMAGMIVNPAVVEAQGENFGTNPVGAGVGPFEFVRFQPKEEIVLEARDDYWGGPVCIERLRFVDVVGEPLTYDSLRNGEVDVAYFREPSTAPQAREDGFQVDSEIVWLGQGLLMNHSVGDPATADVLVRQAVVHALDAEVLSERAFDGELLTTRSIAPESSPYATSVEPLEYDPERAAELIEEAKASGWDGQISLLCQDTTSEVGIAMKTMLDAAGFTTNLETLPIGDFAQRVYVNRDYELACGGAGAADASPWVRLFRFYGPDNFFTGYRNDEFNAALEELRAAASPEEAQPAMEDLQRIWNETVPSAALGSLEVGLMSDDHVHGMLTNVNMMATFARAYVEE